MASADGRDPSAIWFARLMEFDKMEVSGFDMSGRSLGNNWLSCCFESPLGDRLGDTPGLP